MNSFFVLLYIVIFLIAIQNKKFAIIVFIAHMPIRALVHSLGTIPLNDYLSFIVLYHLVFNPRRSHNDSINIKLRNSLIFFLILSVIIIYVTDMRYIYIRDGHISSILSHILHGIVISINAFDIVLIIKYYIGSPVYQSCIDKGFIISSTILSLSTFLSERLYSIGLNFASEEIALADRTAGLFADGDCNGLAGFLCLSTAIIIFVRTIKHIKISFPIWCVIILNVSAIFYTQSRMGFICIIAILLYYLFFLSKGKNTLSTCIYLSLAVVIIFFLTDLSSGVIERLIENDVSSEFSGEIGRSAIWGMFMTYMFSSPLNILFWGANLMPFDIVPHNYYIYIFFVNGLFAAIIYILAQLFVSVRAMNILGYKYVLPINLLTIIPMFFLTSGSIIFYYVIAIALIGTLTNATA